MNTKTKKSVAREILYFFSIATLLLLVWAGIEIRNSFLRNRIDAFSENISNLKTQIDSIENTFPKLAVKFTDLVPDALPTLDELNGSKTESIYDANAKLELDDSFIELPTSELYRFLLKKDFEFSIPNSEWTPPKDAIPDYESFEKDIKKEFGQDKQPYIEKIYNFIKTQSKTFKCDIFSFALCLEGLPKPPPHELWVFTEQLKKDKTETVSKLKEEQNKLLHRNEINGIILWCSIILLGFLYPIRLIFLLLKWSFKTVKQKD